MARATSSVAFSPEAHSCSTVEAPLVLGNGEGCRSEFIRGLRIRYVTKADIFDKYWVEIASLANLLEQGVDDIPKRGVLEALFLGAGEGSLQGKCDDNVVRVFRIA